jgi:hypothetical protein
MFMGSTVQRTMGMTLNIWDLHWDDLKAEKHTQCWGLESSGGVGPSLMYLVPGMGNFSI